MNTMIETKGNLMPKSQIIGYIGVITLFIGVFLPFASAPIIGNINYFRNGEGDGVYILVLSLISVYMIYRTNYIGLFLTGAATSFVLLTSYFHFQSILSDLNTQLRDNPFAYVASLVELQWGFAILVLGNGLLFLSAQSAIKTIQSNVVSVKSTSHKLIDEVQNFTRSPTFIATRILGRAETTGIQRAIAIDEDSRKIAFVEFNLSKKNG